MQWLLLPSILRCKCVGLASRCHPCPVVQQELLQDALVFAKPVWAFLEGFCEGPESSSDSLPRAASPKTARGSTYQGRGTEYKSSIFLNALDVEVSLQCGISGSPIFACARSRMLHALNRPLKVNLPLLLIVPSCPGLNRASA